MADFIIRERFESGFAQVPTSALRDKTLSLKAKGLYAYLFSLPEDWKVYKTEIVNNFSDGKDSMNAAFKELENNGYITVKTIRDEASKQFKGSVLTLHIKPLRETRSGKPVYGEAVNGKSAPTNINNTNTIQNNISLFNNKEDLFSKFIKEFNIATGKKCKEIEKVKRQFIQRLKTYSFDEIMQAVKNAVKDEFLASKNFNDLTPEFITRADKLDRYINYKPNIKKEEPKITITSNRINHRK
jgi:hypothetical protein